MRPFAFAIVIVFGIVDIAIRTHGAPPDKPLVDEVKEPDEAADEASAPVPVITGSEDCACGKSPLSMEGRIMGGKLAKINEYPWTVAIVNKEQSLVFCGGTLICDRYVVTAAHCMQYVWGPDLIQVWLMEEDFEEENENAIPTLKVDVSEILIHPEYSRKLVNNDITLLKLATPVNIKHEGTNKMTPACVPANNDDFFAGRNATVAGWGALAYGRQVVSQLRKLNVPIFSNDDCRTKTRYKKYITENMLCAGFLEGQKDACSGDSGGPLVLNDNGRFLHVGIVSFGHKCGEPNAPGVYARVARYANWIRENTKDCQYCSR